MTRRWTVIALVALLAAFSAPATADTPPPAPTLHYLQPGGAVSLPLTVPVNIVYVGLSPGGAPTGIDSAGVEAAQPSEASPQVRNYLNWGRNGNLGLDYHYAYHSVFADPAFNNAFFAYLASIAQAPSAPTTYQQAYSAQRWARQIRQNSVIDPVATESWLATHAGPMLNVDTTRPTVFFVNWWGRSDFRFHTYGPQFTQPGQPFSLGLTARGQVSAWGGDTPDDPQHPLAQLARIWFYDVSAGPDYTSGNWDLTTQEPPGDTMDGIAQDRLPPIWEYGSHKWFRPFDNLSADLARVVRYVAIDTMFTASPLYDPALSPPLLTDDITLHVDVMRESPDDPLATFFPAQLAAPLAALDPTRHFTTATNVRPFLPLEEQYQCGMAGFWAVNTAPQSCYSQLAGLPPYWDLWYYLSQPNPRHAFLDGTRYEVPIMLFSTGRNRWAGISFDGFSSDRPFTGIQQWVYAWDNPATREQFYPATSIVLHEIGHHLGLSHVHDGLDAATGAPLHATDELGIMHLGDESATVMSYLPLRHGFSQFDRDNVDRWQTAVRLQAANRILKSVYDSGRAGRGTDQLNAADADAHRAQVFLAQWDLRRASLMADRAYNEVVAAAAAANVDVESWSAYADEGDTGYNAWAADPVTGASTSSTQSTKPPVRPTFLDEPGPDQRPVPPGANDLTKMTP